MTIFITLHLYPPLIIYYSTRKYKKRLPNLEAFLTIVELLLVNDDVVNITICSI